MSTALIEPAADAPAADFKARLNALPSNQRLTPTQTEAIYSAAYSFLEQGHFDKAREFFAMLMLLRPGEVKYLQGLAISLRQLDRPGEAAGIWQFIEMVEPQQPAHALARAECLLLAGDMAAGSECLDRVIAAAADDAAMAPTRQRAQAMRELLRARQGGAS